MSAIGKAAIDHVTGDDLVVLIGIGTAIKDGDTTVEQAFKGAKTGAVAEDVISHEDLTELFNAKYDALTDAKKTLEYKRILEQKEVKSYTKMQKELSAL